MSSQPSSRYPSTSHSRNRIYTTDPYQKSAQSYYTPHEPRMTRSSSPIRSSSPPATPHSIRQARNDALIRSSPEIASDTLIHSVREHMENPSSAWGLRYLPNGYPERTCTPLKRDSFSNHSYPPLSDFDVSDYSEDVDHDIPEADSEHTSDSVPGRNSVFFSDTEEENDGGNDEFSFGHDGYRTTFFRTSAERGQWKSHPISFKSTPLSQARKSASILSRPPTPVLVDSPRTNSEPAPSTVTGLGLSVEPDQHGNLQADDFCPISFDNLAERKLQPEAESPHTMSSDWESILDINVDRHEYKRPSSPLPPSSPISYSMSILSGSVSPASSPVMRSSSPLSEISSLDQEERHAGELECHPDGEVNILSSVSTCIFDLGAEIQLNALDSGPAITTTDTTPLKSDSPPLSLDATVNPDFASSNSPATAQNPDHGTKLSSCIAGDDADITCEAMDAIPPPDSPVVYRMTDSIETLPERCEPAQETQAHLSISERKVEADNNKNHPVRRKKRKENDGNDKHLTSKKRKVDVKVTDLLRPMTHNLVRNEKMGAHAEKDEKNHDQQVFAKQKRRKKSEVEVSVPCPASSAKRSKPHRPPLPQVSSLSHMSELDRNDDHKLAPLSSTQDSEAAALNAEICGMLIETMALSRASSLPLSSLYKMVMQTQPSLRSQRSEQEWLRVFALVLQEGETEKGSGVFGKVESSGKDDSNRPLEAQWFYVPEQDQDQERAALLRSMMPRPAKRTETKKYKQYYWRPLDKISKWDPEDEL